MESIDFKIRGPFSCLLQFGAFCVLITGCGGGPVQVEEEIPETQNRLLAIGDAYTSFTKETGRAPRNDKDLKKYLQAENPDEMFLSPRDGKPFVICYGLKEVNDPTWAKPNTMPIVAYESSSDGSRWVLCPPGMAFEIDEEEFAAASFPPGHTVQK